MKHEQVIYGQPPSKANLYKIITLVAPNGKKHGSLSKNTILYSNAVNIVIET